MNAEKLFKLTMTSDRANWELYYQLAEGQQLHDEVVKYFQKWLETVEVVYDNEFEYDELYIILPFGMRFGSWRDNSDMTVTYEFIDVKYEKAQYIEFFDFEFEEWDSRWLEEIALDNYTRVIAHIIRLLKGEETRLS